MFASLVVFALTQSPLFAVPSPEWNDNYGLALRRASETGKPLAVIIGSGQTGWETMSTSGQLDDQSRRLLAEKYVCLYVDASDEKGRKVAQSFQASTLPMLVISDKSRNYQIYWHYGAMSDSQLADKLQRYCDWEVGRPISQPAPISAPIYSSYYQPPVTHGYSAPSAGACRT